MAISRTEAESRTEAGPGDEDQGEEELLVLVIRTAKAIVDRLRSEHPDGESSSMTVVHGLAARYLLGRDDVTAGELACYLGITKQSTSEVLNALEEIGFVRRAPHPTDRRARVLLLTDEGMAKLSEGRRRWSEIELEWAALVGRDRLDGMRVALEAYLASDAGAHGRPGTPCSEAG